MLFSILHRTRSTFSPRSTGFAVLLAVLSQAPATPADEFTGEIRPLLDRYCFGCHDADSAKGGVNLARYDTERSVHLDPRRWESVVRLLRDREMPPPKKRQPTAEERERLTDWLTSSLRDMDYSLIPRDPGPKLIHRLGRLEYNRTVQDLFDITLQPADKFPADGSGGAGFDNNAAALFLPPILMEKYLAAAGEILAAAPPLRLFPFQPGPGLEDRAAAAQVLARHARSAFRGPVSTPELDALLGLYEAARRRGLDWPEAVRTSLKAVLVSPRFLFRIESDPSGAAPGQISDFELATRLSYFLWSSTPDETLLDLAEAGRLRDPSVLREQTRRLLAHPRARTFAENFITQWLGIRRLKGGTGPDPRRFPDYTPALRDAMVEEPVRVFAAILKGDRDLLELLDADYTYANPDLARLYGIDVGTNAAPAESGDPDAGWTRIQLTDRNRGGVVTMPAVLTLTSYPQRTSPVLRGRWILEEILGAPPPPPPPNVGGLPPDDQPRQGLTFRQRLEQHRTKPECAACHARMDPLGFGLENFDPMGRWRDKLGDVAIDATGEFNTGEKFDGPAQLKALLVRRQAEFLRNLTEKMLSYALGRGLEYYDVPTVKAATEALQQGGRRSSILLEAIIHSFPFQHRRGSAVPGVEQPVSVEDSSG